MQVDAFHVEYHDSSSNKFWRCYLLENVWVAQWGPCSTRVGQYKHFVSRSSDYDGLKRLTEKVDKGGYKGQQKRSWHVTEDFHSAILRGDGLIDLGLRFDQELASPFIQPVEEVIAGLQAIRLDLQG